MPYTRTRRFLNREASNIWDEVTFARGPGADIFRFGEVGVTERLHLHMMAAGHLASGMIVYGEPPENISGADWEWIIELPGRRRGHVIIYRIQAKILQRIQQPNPPSLHFKHINHDRGQQRNRLITQAAGITHPGLVGAFPFYCFYIGNPWPVAARIAIPRWPVPVLMEHFGATVVPAQVVDGVHTAAAGKRRSTTEANQYLTAGAPNFDLATGRGRRLSDLFPDSPNYPGYAGGPPPPPPGPGRGGVGPGGPGQQDGPSAIAVDDLPPSYAADIDQIRQRPDPAVPLVVRRPAEEGRPRRTAYFLADLP